MYKKTLHVSNSQTIIHNLVLSVVVVSTVLLLSVTGLFTQFQLGVLTLSNPIVQQSAVLVATVTRPLESIFSGIRKDEKIKNLSFEVSALQSRVADLEYVEAENKALRALLENSDRTLSEIRVAAPIVSLAYPAVSLGSNAGILPNRAVVLSGTLIGVVTEVFSEQSRVMLLSQSHIKPILVRTESGVEGVVIGDGKSVLMKHIPREIEVHEGERVFTLGQEGIRKNMFVGKISRVIAQPSAPTKEATIEQYVSFYDALVVEIW